MMKDIKEENKNKVDQYIEWLKNHKLISILILGCIVYFGISQIIESTDKNWDIVKKHWPSPQDTIDKKEEIVNDTIANENEETHNEHTQFNISHDPSSEILKIKNNSDTNNLANTLQLYRIQILSNKSGEIYINDVFYGKTDKSIDLKAGIYNLKFVSDTTIVKDIITIPNQTIITINL